MRIPLWKRIVALGLCGALLQESLPVWAAADRFREQAVPAPRFGYFHDPLNHLATLRSLKAVPSQPPAVTRAGLSFGLLAAITVSAFAWPWGALFLAAMMPEDDALHYETYLQAESPDLDQRLQRLARIEPLTEDKALRQQLSSLRSDALPGMSRDQVFKHLVAGKPLIPPGAAESLRDVDTPWGVVDFSRLNDFSRYWGELAIIELARDLELAHWLGLLTISHMSNGISARTSYGNLKKHGPVESIESGVSWPNAIALFQAAQRLAERGTWTHDKTMITYTATESGPEFTINGELVGDPSDAEVAFLLAFPGVEHFGTAHTVLPSEIKRLFRWPKLDMNRQLVEELRDQTRLLAKEGTWTRGETTITYIATEVGPEFTINGEPVGDPSDAEVAFLLAFPDIEHFGNAYTVLPSELRRLFRWSMLNMNRRLVEELRDQTRLLAKEGTWTHGETTITYIATEVGPEFTINGEPVGDPSDAEVAFLLACPDIEHFGAAYTVLPNEIKRLFRWPVLDMNRRLVEELRDQTRLLAKEGTWTRGATTITYTATEPGPQFTINGELVEDRADAEVAFLLTFPDVEHFGAAYTVLPNEIKRLFRWPRLNMNRRLVEELRAQTRLLANERTWTRDKIVITYTATQAGPVFTINGERIEDPSDAEAAFLLAFPDVEHFGNAHTVLPSEIKRFFRWPQLNMNRRLVEELRDQTRLLAKKGTWTRGDTTITYTATEAGLQFKINGERIEDPSDAEVAFLLTFPDAENFGAAYTVLPNEINRLFRWPRLDMNRQLVEELRDQTRLLAKEGIWTRDKIMITYTATQAGPVFTINGEPVEDPTDVEVTFLLAFPDVEHFGNAHTVLPSEIKRFFRWPQLNMNRRLVEELRDQTRLLAKEGTWTRGDTTITYTATEAGPQFRINGEPVEDPADAEVAFLLAFPVAEHFGAAYTVLPSEIKRLFRWPVLDMNRQLVEELRDQTRLLAKEGTWTRGDTTITYTATEAGPQFRINGETVEDPADAEVAFLLAFPDVEHFGAAYTVLPSEIKRLFRWPKLNMNRRLLEELRAGAWSLAHGEFIRHTEEISTRMTYARGSSGPSFTLNGENIFPGQAQTAFFAAFGVESPSPNDIYALPASLRRTRHGPGLFQWQAPATRASELGQTPVPLPALLFLGSVFFVAHPPLDWIRITLHVLPIGLGVYILSLIIPKTKLSAVIVRHAA